MLTVNGVLTVAQLACGWASNSLSLLSDGMLMAMDGVCYGVGLYAERIKADAREAERADRLGALFSTVMLALTTLWVLFDVLDRLLGDAAREDAPGATDGVAAVVAPVQEVDGGVMIGFTAVNLVADALVVLACWHFGAGDLLEGGSSPSVASDKAAGESGKATNMNIFGAFAHLAADGVRGIAVLVCGILAVADVVDATKVDAYCSLFVCAFVLAAAVSLLRAVLRRSAPAVYEQVDLPEPNQTAGSYPLPSAIGSPENSKEECCGA